MARKKTTERISVSDFHSLKAKAGLKEDYERYYTQEKKRAEELEKQMGYLKNHIGILEGNIRHLEVDKGNLLMLLGSFSSQPNPFLQMDLERQKNIRGGY